MRRGWTALDGVPQTDRPLKVPRGLFGRPGDLSSGARGDPPDSSGCPTRWQPERPMLPGDVSSQVTVSVSAEQQPMGHQRESADSTEVM